MRWLFLVLCLFLIGCKSYEGGMVEEFPPKDFCEKTDGEWRKVSKQAFPEDITGGIFDVDNHPDYNYKCVCSSGNTWTNTGCF